MKKFFKRYFHNFLYFYRRIGSRLFVRIGLSISVGLLDGFGLTMFLPLLQMVDGANIDSRDLGNLKFLLEGMTTVGIALNLKNILLIMSLFFILKGVVKYLSATYELKIRLSFIKSMRLKLSLLLSRMQYKAFVKSDVGRIQNTLSGEITKLSQAYQDYFNAFQYGIMVVIYMLFAFFIDPKFALLICLGAALTNIAFSWIYKTTKAHSIRLTKDANLYQSLILQFTTNFKYLKATGYIQKYHGKFADVVDFFDKLNRKIGNLEAVISSTREPILVIIVSSVILIQLSVFNGNLGPILISLLFFYRALNELIQLQSSYNRFVAVSGTMTNMTEFETELEKTVEKSGGTFFSKIASTIELIKATFFYCDTAVLKDINLKISKNQTIAFVGESGSGKTTIVNVIAGLMPLTAGQLIIDDLHIKDINKESYRARIGYITQEPVIFNDTIFSNVTLWDEQSAEQVERFKQACRQANIYDFVYSLPEKESTILGNNGINLSGGQKQRISIARELYKDIDLIIFDEATSALDSETEKYIQKSINNLHGKYTILIVAHRLSTIKQADQIILMDNGEIAAEGPYDELILKSEKFKRMVELQEI